jgi:hypothetical protein
MNAADDHEVTTDDFFEPDESVEDVIAAFNAGKKRLTRRPSAGHTEILLVDELGAWVKKYERLRLLVAAELGLPDFDAFAVAEARGRAEGIRWTVEQLRAEAVVNAAAEAICRVHLPWTRSSENPIVDPGDYAAFVAEAEWCLTAIAAHLEAVEGDDRV